MMGDKIKITAEELDLYADVAEVFEDWLHENPGNKEDMKINPDDSIEEQAMKQSYVYAKTYLQLYILFLKIMPRIPKEELDFGEAEITFDENTERTKVIKKFMTEKQLMEDMSIEDKEMFAEKLEELKIKGAFQ